MRALAIGIIAAAAASAQADPLQDLVRELPAGWHVQVVAGELAITRDQPVQLAGRYHENAPAHTGNNPTPSMPSGPPITLALRYRIAPKWTAAELATAKATNDKVYAQLRALRDKYQVDTIHTSKGRPLPMTTDEQQRLTAYEADHARVSKQLVALPRCTLGASSVFDDAGTYSQLDMIVDPASAMREAYAIVELVKRRCR